VHDEALQVCGRFAKQQHKRRPKQPPHSICKNLLLRQWSGLSLHEITYEVDDNDFLFYSFESIVCSTKYLGNLFDYCDSAKDFANDRGVKDLTNELISTGFD
jgi:hypothetical protein